MSINKIDAYIRDLFSEKQDLSRSQYIQNTELQEFTPVVDDDVARLLKVLIRLTRPKTILEIGTSIGFSTTSMAGVVKNYGGRITTIEYDQQVAAQARLNFQRHGVADSITIRIGDAEALLKELDGVFDLIFLDVDKRLYPRLLPDCVRLLPEGGILVADDALFPVMDLGLEWHSLIPPIDEFNRLVVKNPLLESTLLNVGDGIMFAVKKGSA
jgi:caffeoyl-CoA O-methyltransferase